MPRAGSLENRVVLGIALAACLACARTPHDPRRPALCEVDPEPARVLRFAGPEGPAFGLVVEDQRGVPTRVLNLSALHAASGQGGAPLEVRPELFELAETHWQAWRTARPDERRRGALDPFVAPVAPEQICSPAPVSADDIDSGRKMILGAGLNYAAHAAESGGGGVFVFPKPVPPTGPYRPVVPREPLPLLDYEVELAFVALEDLDLHALPAADDLESRIAYLSANDLSDRHAILNQQPVIGVSTGYAEAKGKPGFLPLGPWMVRGSSVRAFSEQCSRSLRMSLEVEEEGVRSLRQDATSDLMKLPPRALLASLAETVDPLDALSLDSVMTFVRGGVSRVLQVARIVEREGEKRAVLPRGSVVVTGTPEGVAFHAPSRSKLVGRSLLNLRPPLSQLVGELEASREIEGYLEPGDRVIARIEGLGVQDFEIGAPDPATPASDPCDP